MSNIALEIDIAKAFKLLCDYFEILSYRFALTVISSTA